MGPYLIDSNAIIDYRLNRIPAENIGFMDHVFTQDFFQISVAAKIEVLGFNTSPEATAEMEEFIAGATIFQLDESVTRRTIELRRRYKLKLGDAIIAATALEYNLTLITHNVADFKRVDGLSILNPYDPIAPEINTL
jgi:predicted nucleic acid-binding protein